MYFLCEETQNCDVVSYTQTSLLNNEGGRQSVQPSLLISLHLHHLSSIIIRPLFPPCLVFITSLPPSWISPSPSFICIFGPKIPLFLSRRSSLRPDPVVPGFQMVWLAEGSELTPQQLILSHRKPRGVWQGTHFSGRMRGRGQEEGLRAEGGLYNSRSCH